MSPDLDQIHAVAHARPVADDAAGGREGRIRWLAMLQFNARSRAVLSQELRNSVYE
jgi:hypothetical protein